MWRKISETEPFLPIRPVFVQTHCGDGVDHAVGDLILPHVFDHVKLSGSLLGDDLVGDLLQFGIKLFKQILKQQRQQLEEEEGESSYMALQSWNRLQNGYQQ